MKTRPPIGPHSQAQSFRKLDGRGTVARRLKARVNEISADYGGCDALSVAQRRLVEQIAQREWAAAQIFGELAEGTASERDRRTYNWLLNGIGRDFARLGEPRRKDSPRLHEVLGQGGAA